MVQEFYPFSADAVRHHLEALAKNTKCMQELTLAFTQLFDSKSNTPNPIVSPTMSKPMRWFFRSWEDVSRAKLNGVGDIVSGDPDWNPGPGTDNIALHYAEFHSDEFNQKDTARHGNHFCNRWCYPGLEKSLRYMEI
ncbi:hypothetical protein J3459_013731 [Metarhizium acridum]|uniref:Uncharacterized protein n=1 Tax=Metarhizium acridum (strain CQMa 102) TaxID=655827 RepID=E9EEW0_METAQ|nr:uncharacterized protein MAC_08408 [Metarhizium acridum CQMa 102]EFY85571.1 hypothetical protein MAC_08408 [Metarhizium acridum CQMa 102]KAG8412862.1 hypothetical protein J3458_013295 [Metarhizium acridum]KAG8416150.1 hypothetical protein J3459_013731 [Metarhizium acridum]